MSVNLQNSWSRTFQFHRCSFCRQSRRNWGNASHYWPGGSTFLCDIMSRPPSWKCDIKSQIRLHSTNRCVFYL